MKGKILAAPVFHPQLTGQRTAGLPGGRPHAQKEDPQLTVVQQRLFPGQRAQTGQEDEAGAEACGDDSLTALLPQDLLSAAVLPPDRLIETAAEPELVLRPESAQGDQLAQRQFPDVFLIPPGGILVQGQETAIDEQVVHPQVSLSLVGKAETQITAGRRGAGVTGDDEKKTVVPLLIQGPDPGGRRGFRRLFAGDRRLRERSFGGSVLRGRFRARFFGCVRSLFLGGSGDGRGRGGRDRCGFLLRGDSGLSAGGEQQTERQQQRQQAWVFPHDDHLNPGAV